MRREWTKNEEQYMQRRYLRQSVIDTAIKLNRSVASVSYKATKMGLANHYTDLLTASTLAKCFNVGFSVVKRWIEKYGLPHKKVRCRNQTRVLIESGEFWKWAEKHKGIINWGKYDKLSICPEPAWIAEEISNYSAKRTGERYSEEEIRKIKLLLKIGWSYKEIAKEVDRTYYGISHLCKRIFKDY